MKNKLLLFILLFPCTAFCQKVAHIGVSYSVYNPDGSNDITDIWGANIGFGFKIGRKTMSKINAIYSTKSTTIGKYAIEYKERMVDIEYANHHYFSKELLKGGYWGYGFFFNDTREGNYEHYFKQFGGVLKLGYQYTMSEHLTLNVELDYGQRFYYKKNNSNSFSPDKFHFGRSNINLQLGYKF